MLDRARFSALCLPLAIAVSTLAVGCKQRDGVAQVKAADEGVWTGSDPAAGAATMNSDLAGAGFTPAEIKAVTDSITISEWLGVESFVDDANAGNLKTAPDTVLRRESHGKHQGCLRARFDVTTQNGPGIFHPGASYPAWIRISNGGAFQRDDKSPHISRGWGIKLLNVDETPTKTHDLVMLSSPIFFIADLTHYPGFLKSTGEGKFGLATELLFGLNLAEKKVVVRRLLQKVSNLLDANLYSAVPYRFGDEPVKYALAPCAKAVPDHYPASSPPPSGSGLDYLEDAMNGTLAGADPKAGLCYGFFVQRPKDFKTDSLDDPTEEWQGAFSKVAEITIPAGQQRGGPWDYRHNDADCERIAFNPWNATTLTSPIGKVNLTRKYVYTALADFRRTTFPKIYQTWMANHDDSTVRADLRKELAKLKGAPARFEPHEEDVSEPVVDDGFMALGIVPATH